MKNKVLKKIKYFFQGVMLISPSFFIVSCGTKTSEEPARIDLDIKFTFAKYIQKLVDEKSSVLHDAEIVSWTDGDTLVVNVDPDTDKEHQVKIRIKFIDTPEFHLPNGEEIPPYEKQWAQKARDFGAKELPDGSKLKVYLTGDKSYDREIGALFYGKNFENNYSVNLLRAGLTLPLIGDDIAANLLPSHKDSLDYNVAVPFFQAYEYARVNKVGLYGLSSKDLARAYGTHGTSDYSGIDEIYKFYSNPKLGIDTSLLVE